MFKWLLRRRAHKITKVAIPDLEAFPIDTTTKSEDGLPPPINAWNREQRNAVVVCNNSRQVGRTHAMLKELVDSAPSRITVLALDREDHYTCVKCGHTHIVMRD